MPKKIRLIATISTEEIFDVENYKDCGCDWVKDADDALTEALSQDQDSWLRESGIIKNIRGAVVDTDELETETTPNWWLPSIEYLRVLAIQEILRWEIDDEMKISKIQNVLNKKDSNEIKKLHKGYLDVFYGGGGIWE